FQNEPLGLAKNLVDLVDPQHVNHDDRLYLFVAPNLRGSVMDDGTFTAAQATFAKTAKRLIKTIFNEARYQDWVRVESINQKAARFADEALDLLKLIKDQKVKPQDLAPASTALLYAAFPDAGAIGAATDRLRQQFATDLQAAALPQADADQWLRAVAVLE